MKQSPKKYQVELKPGARRWLDRADKQVRVRLLFAVASLAEALIRRGVKKLTGAEHYRMRVGDYRIVYEVQENLVLILVLKIGHRLEIYRD